MSFSLLRRAFASALTMLAAGLPATAQEYPTRNVTIVVPLAAGTGMDSIVRIYAEDCRKRSASLSSSKINRVPP